MSHKKKCSRPQNSLEVHDIFIESDVADLGEICDKEHLPLQLLALPEDMALIKRAPQVPFGDVPDSASQGTAPSIHQLLILLFCSNKHHEAICCRLDNKKNSINDGRLLPYRENPL